MQLRTNRPGFIIIEVLVAFMVLTMTIALLTYAQKNFQNHIKRLYSFENLYTTVLSLKHKIDIEIQLGDKKYFTGKLNGYNYRIDLVKYLEKHNLRFDEFTQGYSSGAHTYTLYKVNIYFPDIDQTYSFYKMKTKIDLSQFKEFE